MKVKKNLKKAVVPLLLILLVFAGVYAAQEWYRVDYSQDICEHGEFRRVINNYSDDLFVPTKTSQEWSNFRSNPPSNVSVSLIDCCLDGHCSGGSWSGSSLLGGRNYPGRCQNGDCNQCRYAYDCGSDSETSGYEACSNSTTKCKITYSYSCSNGSCSYSTSLTGCQSCGTNEECENGECVPIGCEYNGEWYDVGDTRSCRESCSYNCCGHWASGRGRCQTCSRSNSGVRTCRSSGNWSSCDADEPTCPSNECHSDRDCPDEEPDEPECNAETGYDSMNDCTWNCDSYCEGQSGCSSGSCTEEGRRVLCECR